MTQYFTLDEAAKRYNSYRPKVHSILIDWIKNIVGMRQFENAIDIGCGTGDSTLPLLDISRTVIGIDTSDEMLKYAKNKGINVRNISYEEIPEQNHYDLINTCMAFHWFDMTTAISTFKRISTNHAIWLISNFAFAGHESNNDFNNWTKAVYLKKYPSPPRNKTASVVPRNDKQIKLLSEGNGYIPIHFSHDDLINYLSTQSNIEAAVKNGKRYVDIFNELKLQIVNMDLSGAFKYVYTFEVHEFQSDG
jgi:ubiquinone/menaquinone biosynthesis C-methylase UbiE